MNIIGAILGSTGLAAIIYMLFILAQFGRKLGAVTKMSPYYRGYYIAIGCVGLALMVRLLRISVFQVPSDDILHTSLFYLLLYHLPLAIGLSLSLGITWRYWSWLLKDSER
jgi:hypothetical protein